MRARGFTMIELMIGLVIAAILVMLMAPSYAEFMRNARIRNAADSIASGLRLAQAEAARRNQNVEFLLGADRWQIIDPVTPATLHDERLSDGGGQLVIEGSPAANKVTYSPLGQPIPGTNPSDGTDTMTSVAIRHASVASRDLRVITEAFGQGIRVCDNDASNHVSLRCPAGVP